MADQTRYSVIYDILYESPAGTIPSGVSVALTTYPVWGDDTTKTVETHDIPKEQLKTRIIEEIVDGVTQSLVLSVFMISSTIVTVNTNMLKQDGTNYTLSDIAAIYGGLQIVIGQPA
jgi:hypothetical protein